MGNAVVWYYPDRTGATLVEIDFGEGLSDLPEEPVYIHNSAEAWSGRRRDVVIRWYWAVRPTLENFTPGDLHRSLLTLDAHLRRNGRIGLAADKDKAVAGYSRGVLRAGATTVYLTGGGLNLYNSAASITTGDEVVIQALGGPPRWEVAEVSAFTSGAITLSSGLTQDFPDDVPILIRERNFYPGLRMRQSVREDRPTLLADHRRTYTWDAQLEEDPTTLRALTALGQGSLAGTSGTGQGVTIGTLIRGLERREAEGSGLVVDPRVGR